MKAMLVSDLIIMRKYLIQQAAIGLVLGIVLAFVMENPYVITPLVCTMVAVTCAFTVLALDERNGWERYRLALPLSRANVVVGRYASLALVTLIGLAAGLVASVAALATATALMGIGYGTPGIELYATSIMWDTVAFAAIAGMLIVSVMLSLMLPFALRLGMTKAVRLIPAITVVVILVVFAAVAANDALNFTALVDALFAIPGGMIAVDAGIALVAVALYAASAAVACRLYEAREL